MTTTIGTAAMIRRTLIWMLCACAPLQVWGAEAFDAAAAFGARESVSGLTLSPDGRSVAYVAPAEGEGSILYTINLASKSAARGVLRSDGKPYSIRHCDWA